MKKNIKIVLNSLFLSTLCACKIITIPTNSSKNISSVHTVNNDQWKSELDYNKYKNVTIDYNISFNVSYRDWIRDVLTEINGAYKICETKMSYDANSKSHITINRDKLLSELDYTQSDSVFVSDLAKELNATVTKDLDNYYLETKEEKIAPIYMEHNNEDTKYIYAKDESGSYFRTTSFYSYDEELKAFYEEIFLPEEFENAKYNEEEKYYDMNNDVINDDIFKNFDIRIDKSFDLDLRYYFVDAKLSKLFLSAENVTYSINIEFSFNEIGTTEVKIPSYEECSHQYGTSYYSDQNFDAIICKVCGYPIEYIRKS